LAGLKPSRSVAELEALLASQSARLRGECAVANITGVLVCPRNPALVAELGRAKRRSELEKKMDAARAELDRIAAPKQANSDAAALAGSLAAIGVAASPETTSRLLVLLAVLIIECGSGLALAVGMSLSEHCEQRVRERVCSRPFPADATNANTKRPRTPPERSADAADTPSEAPSVRSERLRPSSVVWPSDVMGWLRSQGGRAETSMRRLANALGRSPSGVHDELRRLVASGLIVAASGPRGTVLALTPGAMAASH